MYLPIKKYNTVIIPNFEFAQKLALWKKSCSILHISLLDLLLSWAEEVQNLLLNLGNDE